MVKNQLRIGQRIYSFKYGWGEVIQGDDNPIAISYNEKGVFSYDFLNEKAIPMDFEFTEAQVKGYTISEITDTFKNDLLSELEKEQYDKEMQEAMNSNDGNSFII